MNKKSQTKKTVASLGIIGASLILAFAPIPGFKETLVVVAGTELQESLQKLEAKFENENPSIDLKLEFQGSQDIVRNYIEQQNDFPAQVLIPASGEILEQYCQLPQNQSNCPFIERTAVAKTVLVGIAWQERGNILFPDGKFSWSRIERAMQQQNWSKIAEKANWGSFDFVITNPTRSNSGQLTIDLWLQAKNYDLNSSEAKSLVSLIKQNIYQPPRSTDILLQEFISRGANDGDIAMVYESIALYRWSQAQVTQRQPYKIYYPDTTIETIATATVPQNVAQGIDQAAYKFIAYLTQPEQQMVFIQHGFRPTISGIDLSSVADSPWSQNIPGTMPNLAVTTVQPPNAQEITEIQDLWNLN